MYFLSQSSTQAPKKPIPSIEKGNSDAKNPSRNHLNLFDIDRLFANPKGLHYWISFLF
jgi:hypothetical protein